MVVVVVAVVAGAPKNDPTAVVLTLIPPAPAVASWTRASFPCPGAPYALKGAVDKGSGGLLVIWVDGG